MSPIRNIDYENLSGLNEPFKSAFEERFHQMLETGWFVLGNEVAAFEKEFNDYLGSNYFLGVASGLDALEMPLKIQDWPAESEIIVPSNTYIATINAIINAGHKPVFVEPDISTYLIDPNKIEEKINDKTKAIMVVHLYGRPCEMDPIMELCQKHDLVLIEDCAQSHGATYKCQATGTFGFGAFSFYPTKNLGALGDAGGLSIPTEEDYLKLKAWRNYGSNVKYKNEFIGDNSRLDEIQAGFLRIKLEALDEITEHKRALAAVYRENLDSDKFILPAEDRDTEQVYHIFPIRHKRRDQLKQYLLDNGIKTEIHYPYPPCHQKSIIDTFRKKNWNLDEREFQLAIEIHSSILSLPISTIHSEDDIRYIIDLMNKFE